MVLLMGSRVFYRTIDRGILHCERCGGDRPYQRRSGRRWLHLLGVPVAALGSTGEHLRCAVCRTCYRVELLAVPTMDEMELALLAGTKAAVLAMLGAGGAASPAARRRGIEMIKAAGAEGYDGQRLAAALCEQPAAPSAADPGEADGARATDGPAIGLRPAVEAFAIQLEVLARDWFLARVVEVGLADGPLSAAEREVAGTVARYLGMSPARGRDVVSLAERAAQAG